jgi:hypothetical protein
VTYVINSSAVPPGGAADSLASLSSSGEFGSGPSPAFLAKIWSASGPAYIWSEHNQGHSDNKIIPITDKAATSVIIASYQFLFSDRELLLFFFS